MDMQLEEDDALLIQYEECDRDALRPLSDQEAVEVECSKWAQLWQTDAPYKVDPIEHAECEP